MNIADLRAEYALNSLDESDVMPDPIAQFKKWFAEALRAEIPEPNALHLATVTPNGKPAGRIVLLKELDSGFVFYTNYESRKAQELAQNPSAALTFLWLELERQVRVEGRIEKVSAQESDEYFKSRPLASQIGAIASPQSQVIPNRDYLEKAQQAWQAKAGEPIKRPENWGGFRLIPNYIEFWQGRKSRLHDRIAYTDEGKQWKIQRLAP
ncbi:MAG: pyridoxamine 5'-phosphate oxidase [Bernardetiaceae bacterium]|nr:pyridoxamine 5'-phosphate oxidase [Bernardetiaceae bacterium]